MELFDRVAIVGTGLIGGSMGMAMRNRGLAGHVIGIGRRQVSIDKAMDVGACDEVTLNLEQGVGQADLVVVATPIRAYQHLMPRIGPAMKDGAIVSDVASSKCSVIKTFQDALAGREAVAYVPTHPMAGSEETGPAAAVENLFEGSICIFTPLDDVCEDEVELMRRLWFALGASVTSMTPDEHDRLVAKISHVPHLAAAALVAGVDKESLLFSGGGFIDTTRVASSDTELWSDIYESNRREVCAGLDEHIGILEKMKDLVESGAWDELAEILDEAREKRDELLEKRADFQRNRESC